jgi:hypothetical protein
MASQLLSHLIAMLIRIYILMKRSRTSVLFSIIGIIIFSGLAIFTYILMRARIKGQREFSHIGKEKPKSSDIALAFDQINDSSSSIAKMMLEIFKGDTKTDPVA